MEKQKTKDMKIKVELEVSENERSHTFYLSDLGVDPNEWQKMSDSEKHEIIENAVFDLPSQPYWMVDSFKEI